jgi:hypothetical protein
MILRAPAEWLNSSQTRWYLVFCAATRQHWWDRLFRIRRGWSHVYALRWDGYNWLLFNPHSAYTDVQVMSPTTEKALYALVEPGAAVLEVEAYRRERLRGRWWVGPMTCVEQVKALLGLPVHTVWTPYQLYCHLLREYPWREHETENTGTDRNRGRTGEAPAARARRIDAREKPAR